MVTDIAINGPFSDIDTNTLFTIYRLVQESLTNIQRHSNANNVTITVERIEKFIALKVSDDGYGCDLNNSTQGFGLLGMKERVVECKGLFKTASSKGNGFAIYVLLPCNIPTGAREK
jgi:two-component system sensor histidine kinase UhpB